MDQTNRTTQNILDNSAHFKGLNKNYYKLLLDVKSALVSIQTAAAAAADGIFFIVHRVKDQMHRLNSMTKKNLLLIVLIFNAKENYIQKGTKPQYLISICVFHEDVKPWMLM